MINYNPNSPLSKVLPSELLEKVKLYKSDLNNTK